jgi:hypothetical protein
MNRNRQRWTLATGHMGNVRVNVTLFMRVDIYKNGQFREETSQLTCRLKKKDGKWRLYNAKK